MMTRADIAFEMAKKVLKAAKHAGADCIALACPLCGMMLDAKQPDIEKALNIEIGMPVIYITQLLEEELQALQQLLTSRIMVIKYI